MSKPYKKRRCSNREDFNDREFSSVSKGRAKDRGVDKYNDDDYCIDSSVRTKGFKKS